MKLLNSHPLDYLNFYCLGNREPITNTASQVSGDADKVILLKQDLSFLVFRIMWYAYPYNYEMTNGYPKREKIRRQIIVCA